MSAERWSDVEILYIMAQYDSGPGPAAYVSSAPSPRVHAWLEAHWGIDPAEHTEPEDAPAWRTGFERARYAADALDGRNPLDAFGVTQEELDTLWERHCRGTES